MGELVRKQSEGAESLTMMVISEIAAQEGVDPTRLTPPLHSVIDVDALVNLFISDKDGFVEVEFTYLGHQVTVECEEDVHVEVE